MAIRGASSGPRVMLRGLREAMAKPVGAQDRLDGIVALIAQTMVAEVCSVYVMRAGGILELFATEGLKKEAVHKSTLRVGEGLVGVIANEAEPLNLPDAQSHPKFAYLPETGEEIYSSFLGVPILRTGFTLGVLVVQNRVPRTYSEEEIEALQTIAMVLAETFASGDLDIDPAPDIDLRHMRPHHLQGAPLADGIGLGQSYFHETRITIEKLIAEDVGYEQRRLDEALARLRQSIDTMLSRRDVSSGGEHLDILNAYRMFAYDRSWVKRLQEAVDTGLTAEAAVERVQNDYRAKMMRQTDPYMRERLNDLEDLGNRLLRELVGEAARNRPELPKDAILIARNMGAAELLDYDRNRLRGLVLEDATSTSHVTIVARALGIPTAGQVEGVRDLLDEGHPIIVDGETGAVHVRPPADLETVYVEKVRFRAKRQADYEKVRNLPAITKDGAEIALLINAGLLVDLPHIRESGANGIGLFRTELQFMLASRLPRLRDQERVYASVLDAAGTRPVTFRSLDVGGDKVLPYLQSSNEENPAMGWRAIRLALDRPGLLKTQVRALLKASSGRELRLMFPMVSSVDEFVRARETVEGEKEFLVRHGYHLPGKIELGAMIEVPSILWDLERLMAETDFVSVGSNDLMQFMFAVDRGNPRLTQRFDTLSSSFLRALRQISDAGRAVGTPVTLCGEMASRPLDALAILGLGFRSISIAPAAVGPVKMAVRATHMDELEKRVSQLLDTDSDSIRDDLMIFMKDQGIPI